ncbi:hypothetical protein V7S79_10010 [Aquirufa sp. ROCK-SH2]
MIPILKIKFICILFLFTCTASQVLGQKKRSICLIPFVEHVEKKAISTYAYFSDINKKGKQHSYYDLNSDLAKNVPIPNDVECRFDVEFFLFRINKLNVWRVEEIY